MSLKPFIPFFDNGQVGQRGFEVCFEGGIGRHLQQKACDGVVHRHEHAIACTRGF